MNAKEYLDHVEKAEHRYKLRQILDPWLAAFITAMIIGIAVAVWEGHEQETQPRIIFPLDSMGVTQ